MKRLMRLKWKNNNQTEFIVDFFSAQYDHNSHAQSQTPEVESRTRGQGHKKNPRPRTDTLEA